MRESDVAASIETSIKLAREFTTTPDEFDTTGWYPAVCRTHLASDLILSAFRADLIDWGVVAGLDSRAMIDQISAAVSAMKSDDLYAKPIDETRRAIPLPHKISTRFGPPHTTSDREIADDRIAVLIGLAFEDFLWPFLQVAVKLAWRAAWVRGRDVAAKPDRHGLNSKAAFVKRASAAEREQAIRSATDYVRKLIKDALRDPDLVKRVGRRAEADRDHRAYCLRERLVHSEDFRGMQRNRRYALAKERVIAEVIAPEQGGCSPANFQRIMDSGKIVHARIAPNTPYCDRWPLAVEPSSK